MELTLDTAKSQPQATRRPAISALHIAAIASCAISQPMLDLLARTPEFFVARHLSSAESWRLVMTLGVLLPGTFGALALLLGVLGKPGRSGRLVLLFACLCLFAALVTKTIGMPAGPFAMVPIGLGLVAMLAYSKWSAVGSFLTILSVCILIFPIISIANPTIRQVLWPADVPSVVPTIRLNNPVPVRSSCSMSCP